MKFNQPNRTFPRLLGLLIVAVFFLPTFTFAQEFMPLVRIPGLDNATDLNAYVNALYSLSISIAALIAVVKIVLAGAKYMLTDLVTDKGAAKKDIWNALIGLLIIIGAWLILNTINSDLTNPNILIDTVDNSVPEPDLTTEQTELQRICADATGGCSFTECDDLDDLIYPLIFVGGVVGASYGGTVGGSVGSAIPYIGTIVVGGAGVIIGGGAGVYAGYQAYQAAQAGECAVACYWFDGIIPTQGPNAGTCVYPNDAVAVRNAEIAAEMEILIAEDAQAREALLTENDTVAIGDSLYTGETYSQQVSEAAIIYDEKCPGKVNFNAATQTLSCDALDDNPDDDSIQLECQLLGQTYNPTFERCF